MMFVFIVEAKINGFYVKRNFLPFFLMFLVKSATSPMNLSSPNSHILIANAMDYRCLCPSNDRPKDINLPIFSCYYFAIVYKNDIIVLRVI